MRYGIALGSNMGDRLANLQSAVGLLRQVDGVALLSISPVYETAPVDCPPGSEPFYNAALECESSTSPEKMLYQLQAIQQQLGRDPHAGQNAPRSIDLDILYADDLCTSTPQLELPHPRMTQRRFVLQPLAIIRPELILPGQVKSIAEMLRDLNSAEPALHMVSAEWC